MIRFGSQRLMREVAPAFTICLAASSSTGESTSSSDKSVHFQDACINSEDKSSTNSLKTDILTLRSKDESSSLLSQWAVDSSKILFSKSSSRFELDTKTSESTTYVASLIRPTFEATCRALRLISTFVSIVIDYEVLPHIPQLRQQKIDTSTDYNEITQQRLYWEQQVKYYSEQLKAAQKEYTKSSSSTEKSVKERKEAVHSAAQRLGEAEANFLLYGGKKKSHERAAQKLLKLCRNNGGVYIKVGQVRKKTEYSLSL